MQRKDRPKCERDRERIRKFVNEYRKTAKQASNIARCTTMQDEEVPKARKVEKRKERAESETGTRGRLLLFISPCPPRISNKGEARAERMRKSERMSNMLISTSPRNASMARPTFRRFSSTSLPTRHRKTEKTELRQGAHGK